MKKSNRKGLQNHLIYKMDVYIKLFIYPLIHFHTKEKQ